MNEEVQGAVEPIESTDSAAEVVETNESTDQAQEQDHEQPEKSSDADKALRAAQRRIDRLTAEKYKARAEVEQLRASMNRGQDDYQQLTEQDVETLAEQKAREITELNQFNAKCDDVYAKGTKESERFPVAFKSLVDEIGTPFDERGRPTSVMAAILDADEPHKLILHLAENPDLAAELADLPANRQIRRIAQIERDMTAPPPKSSAPTPTKPLTGGAPAKKDVYDPDLSYDDYVKLRREQIKNRR